MLRHHRVISAALFLVFFFVPRAGASDMALNIETLVQKSEFVFEGWVIGREARQSPTGSVIHTYVTFAVVDVLKGTFAERNLTLSFLGGTVGTTTMEVSDTHTPAMGEHGIYCIESLKRTISDPRYGGDQGHFIIRMDPFTHADRVTTFSGKAVMAIDTGARTTLDQLSNGVAYGINAREADVPGGMSPFEFKSRLRQMAAAK